MKLPSPVCSPVITLLLALAGPLSAADELSGDVALEIDFLRTSRDEQRVQAAAPVNELGTKYEAALERLSEQARGAGKFPVVVAANDSLKEFKQAGIPNGTSDNPELVKMESVYLEQLAKIKAQARPGFVKLEQDYAAQLSKMAASLKEKNETTDVDLVLKQVKRQEAFIKRLEAGMEVPIGKGSRVPGEMPASAVTILKATFGSSEKSADVTAKVAEYVATRRDFSANAKGLGVDPHPGKPKRLMIAYEKDGKRREQGRNPNETVLYESFAGPQDPEELDAWLAGTYWKVGEVEATFHKGKKVAMGKSAGTWALDKGLRYMTLTWSNGETMPIELNWRYTQFTEMKGERRAFEREF